MLWYCKQKGLVVHGYLGYDKDLVMSMYRVNFLGFAFEIINCFFAFSSV